MQYLNWYHHSTVLNKIIQKKVWLEPNASIKFPASMNDVQTRNISIQNKNKVCEFNKNFSDKYVLL